MYNRFFIRTDDWLLIADNRGKNRMLYDLRSDPHEFTDVVHKHPDVGEQLYQQVLEAAGGPLPYYANPRSRAGPRRARSAAAPAKRASVDPRARTVTRCSGASAAITTLDSAHRRHGSGVGEAQRGEHRAVGADDQGPGDEARGPQLGAQLGPRPPARAARRRSTLDGASSRNR